MSNHSVVNFTQKDSGFLVKQLFAPLLAVIIGTFMVILDSTVVNVAIPTLE